ncbi:MAG: CehA/McbA family metallohydrolase [Bacteroidia bacterium]|nr:CehA/McbA family metallohydrolase [Bacteroidia bacterium]
MKTKNILLSILFILFQCTISVAQHEGHGASAAGTSVDVEPQPLLAQAIRLQDALSFLGSSLSAHDIGQLKSLQNKALDNETVKRIQEILDPYCLAIITINPEARVKVVRGMSNAKLMQSGWTSFLVKVNNDAGVTAKLEVESPNASPALHISSSLPRVKEENILTPGQAANRFLEMSMYRNPPLKPNLSGLKLEYAVLQIYSKDAGQREAEIGFNIGQGSQDIGFRNSIPVLFAISQPVKVVFHIKDDDGSPTIASFTITDGVERILEDSIKDKSRQDYRAMKARQEYGVLAKELKGVYPLPSRRVAAYDEYPDFFFQPQVYRADGEHVMLPPGKYNVAFTRGPEYILTSKEIIVPSGVASYDVTFQLKRWIDLAKLGWYSADHHIHGAGCSHYESPEEGVPPADMWRQVLGEDLKVAASLAWGPSWYHQKTFFTGKDDPLSTKKNIMRNDVEVSGFPSSHAGHVVLLRIKEDDYPGTTTIEEWPSWTLPVLSWAKSQGGVVGYAHSGWGLEPMSPTNDLPNYVLPKMDGIGANEYIVTVTQDAVDFFSAGDTPAPWELNMWYNVLNSGFKTRLSGETDFPCIFDERVGLARSYFKTDGPMTYDNYVEALKKGRGYVSDGGSHIINFSVNGIEPGLSNSELTLKNSQTVKIKGAIAAFLSEQQDERGATIAKRKLTNQPYWHVERARVANSQKVKVELIVNGKPVDAAEIVADGSVKDVNFSYLMERSGWVAIRIYPSSHTNPVFVNVAGQPIQELQSAEWCRKAVDQCWKMKQSRILPAEQAAAAMAYDKARQVYDKIIKASR